MTPLVWTKSKDGWGITEYRAQGTRGEYLAKKTGGRFHKWGLTLRRPGDHRWSGDFITSASTLKSCKEIAEMQDGRASA